MFPKGRVDMGNALPVAAEPRVSRLSRFGPTEYSEMTPSDDIRMPARSTILAVPCRHPNRSRYEGLNLKHRKCARLGAGLQWGCEWE